MTGLWRAFVDGFKSGLGDAPLGRWGLFLCLLAGGHRLVYGEDRPLGRARVFINFCVVCGRKRCMYGAEWLTESEFLQRNAHLLKERDGH
jgi:hypothetical protein